MEIQVIKKYSARMSLLLLMFLSVFVSKEAGAHGLYAKGYVPVAICSTGGTDIPLPYFVCCQQLDEHGHHLWRDTWVPTTCKNAHPNAIYDMGCKTSSPDYGMGSPIIGNCQFSYSTDKFI